MKKKSSVPLMMFALLALIFLVAFILIDVDPTITARVVDLLGI